MKTVSIEQNHYQHSVERASWRVNMHPNVLLCAYRERVRGKMCETEGNTRLRYFLSLLHNFSLAERLSTIVVFYVCYCLRNQRALSSTNHIVVFYRQPEHKVYSRYSDTASLCLSFCSAWRTMGLRLFLNYPNYKSFTLFKLYEWNVEAPIVLFFDSQHIYCSSF